MKKQEGETQEWKQAVSGDVIKLDEGERIEGKFNSIEESLTFEDSYALKLETKEGLKTLFVSEMAKNLIDINHISQGQEIAIFFTWKDNQKGTRKYKNYTILFR